MDKLYATIIPFGVFNNLHFNFWVLIVWKEYFYFAIPKKEIFYVIID
jgi:hypothetical protein